MSAVSLLPLVLSLTVAAEGRRSAIVEVVEKAGPAVVSIGAEIVEQNPFRRSSPYDDLWRDFFNGKERQGRTEQSLGSGVIIQPDGVILTNEHVIARANSITVTLRDRRTFEADVVGADPAFDIAILKLRNAKDMPAVELGTSSDLMPGETLVAIGNPFGLSNTVTTGVVSALHRSVPMQDRAYEDFIQTDAAINPGNSGGALLNIEGKLIGINTAIYGGGSGIGFAIPIDKARAVLDEVMRYGEVRPAYLGLVIDRRSTEGAKVLRVDKGDPGGLEAGDVIIDVGGQQVPDGLSLLKIQRSLIPGQKARLKVVRRGQTLNLELKVRELTPERAAQIGRERLGIEVEAVRGGLVVYSVKNGSDAARVGIKKGDALLSVAGRGLRSKAEFDAVAAAIREADAIAVIIGRAGRRYYVTLQLD
ncbi:MAG: trypsin-like peptidase domain-containing protein [Myxococcota bacterium]